MANLAEEKKQHHEPSVKEELSRPSSGGLHHDRVAEEAIGGHTHDLPEGYYYSLAFTGTVIAVCLSQISGYLGWVLPSNTLLLINQAIGPSPDIIWVPVSWTAGLAVGFPLVGRLSDIFGRRWFCIWASLLGLVGTIIGACAQSINMLIVTNSINGLAAAGQLSFCFILGELVPNKLRGPVNNLVLLTSMPFAVFGPPIARAFYENTALQWRWSYILGAIVNTVAVLLYFFFYHPPSYDMLHVGGKSKLKQLKTLDWVGLFLFTAGLVVFLIGLNWGGGVYRWNSGHVLGALFAGFFTLVIFGFWEAYSNHEYPFIPMRLFKNIRYDAMVACASFGAVVYYANTVIWPSMIGALFTTDVKETGWLSCAVGGGLLLGQLLGGLGLRYLPRMKIQMTVASIICVAFVASVAASNATTKQRTTAFLLMGSIGAGYVENLTLSATAYLWDPADMGLVLGALGAIRTAVSAVATSMYSSILATEAAKYIPKYVTPAAVGAGLPSSSLPALFTGISTGNFSAVQGMTPEIMAIVGAQVKHAYGLAYRTVFLCTLPFGALLLIASLLTPNVDKYLTDEVARKLHGTGEKTEASAKHKEVVEGP
ncbi:fungal trichothecene efflux pump [Westerdykella ornata]|uniref:Fungal trichothecene efflux pump n=1 Tax=Westerdykella ornata TaxID=318751 RepID=A0A6A6JS35_WESOR|nr:fungal trichothecene efflux pump [Westerdykella ornata]KAF2278923.1 fungal trichothecene efflux pump [Westerdykella ornata]